MTDAKDVLDFWLGDDVKAKWFEKDAALDGAIGARFGGAVEAAGRGDLDAWAETAEGALALLILLDQFPRNLFRNQPRAFAFDAKARAVARRAVARGLDRALPPDVRHFVYLPFEHSEDLADQDWSLALFEALGDAAYLDFAHRHRVIVARFGRFPHRNRALGRASTAEEAAFLEEPGSGF
ncbi:MAG: DUF924 domain-containing protein [Geminicoccaceae bacterium]|nr:DUF924 domain-containing protein [Geminicoccaceae bacterium]